MTKRAENNELPENTILEGRLELIAGGMYQPHEWGFRDQDENGATENSGGSLHSIEKGDILMVFNDAARRETIWAGVVDFDYKAHMVMSNPWGGFSQQMPGGGLIDGIPKIPAEAFPDWIRMFKAEKPAILIRPSQG